MKGRQIREFRYKYCLVSFIQNMTVIIIGALEECFIQSYVGIYIP